MSIGNAIFGVEGSDRPVGDAESVNDQIHECDTTMEDNQPTASEQSVCEFGAEEKRRTVDPGLVSALDELWYAQIYKGEKRREDLLDRMANMVAWTWLPIRPKPICGYLEAKLAVMDRFSTTPSGIADHIGLTLYSVNVARNGLVSFAGEGNCVLFKDFSLAPKDGAIGLCLDAQNTAVFQTGLALDAAMEAAAANKYGLSKEFVPPNVLFGFPKYYIPHPEWSLCALKDAIRTALSPNAPQLQALTSPGGKVIEVKVTRNNFRVVTIKSGGNTTRYRFPEWIILAPYVREGSIVPSGKPLGDLPRVSFDSPKELRRKYPHHTLEWLQERLLEEATEYITTEEPVYERGTRTDRRESRTWRCLPSQLISAQTCRVSRFFVDLRAHLGRTLPELGDGIDLSVTCPAPEYAPRIEVMEFDGPPSFAGCRFHDGTQQRQKTWLAELLTTRIDKRWDTHFPLRGKGSAK